MLTQHFQAITEKPELDRVVLLQSRLLGQPDEWGGIASRERIVKGVAPGVGVGGPCATARRFWKTAHPEASPGEVSPRRTRAQASSAPAAARVISRGRAASCLPSRDRVERRRNQVEPGGPKGFGVSSICFLVGVEFRLGCLQAG